MIQNVELHLLDWKFNSNEVAFVWVVYTLLTNSNNYQNYLRGKPEAFLEEAWETHIVHINPVANQQMFLDGQRGNGESRNKQKKSPTLTIQY